MRGGHHLGASLEDPDVIHGALQIARVVEEHQVAGLSLRMRLAPELVKLVVRRAYDLPAPVVVHVLSEPGAVEPLLGGPPVQIGDALQCFRVRRRLLVERQAGDGDGGALDGLPAAGRSLRDDIEDLARDRMSGRAHLRLEPGLVNLSVGGRLRLANDAGHPHGGRVGHRRAGLRDRGSRSSADHDYGASNDDHGHLGTLHFSPSLVGVRAPGTPALATPAGARLPAGASSFQPWISCHAWTGPAGYCQLTRP